MAKAAPRHGRTKHTVVRAIIHDVLDRQAFTDRRDLIEVVRHRCAKLKGVDADPDTIASAIQQLANVRRDVPGYPMPEPSRVITRDYRQDEVRAIGRREATTLLDKLMNSPRTSETMRQCLIAGLKTIPSPTKGV